VASSCDISILLDGADDEPELYSEDERTRLTGVTFKWPYAGTSVLVTGSFFNWRNTIALHKREKESPLDGGELDVFSTVLYLPPGKFEYKFVVDGAWHYDPHQRVVTDESGNLNNIVVVEPLFDHSYPF